MNKQIPFLFESVVISSPFSQISNSEPNTGRLKVGVFTKYTNRNYSYITDSFAEHLIKSAVEQHCPVVGFYDKETNTWASHTGPSLANAYGYVEDFIGWEPLMDSDGEVRDYAVFQIVLHVNYFKEAQYVKGMNQSMELNPETIEGDWIQIEGTEYFAYTKGEMLGFCIIGEHEPCFSASSFFSKNEEFNTRFEQFSSLLIDLKNKVEETKNFEEGGEQTMEENMMQEEIQTEEVVTEYSEETENENVAEIEVEAEIETEVETETTVEEFEVKTVSIEEYEALLNKFEELTFSCANLEETIAALQNEIECLRTDCFTKQEAIDGMRADQEACINELEEAKTRIQAYERMEKEIEKEKKENLIKSYEKIISAEEITTIAEEAADISYDELESKLAVTFSRKQLKAENARVPLTTAEDSSFAALIQKYKKI